MKNKLIIALITLSLTASAYAAYKCYYCKGSGWNNTMKCVPCGGDGAMGD